MKIDADFYNRTAHRACGQPLSLTVTDLDRETLFRRLCYTYGAIVDTERVTRQETRYTLVARMQYPDTRETYELETTLTVTQ